VRRQRPRPVRPRPVCEKGYACRPRARHACRSVQQVRRLRGLALYSPRGACAAWTMWSRCTQGRAAPVAAQDRAQGGAAPRHLVHGLRSATAVPSGADGRYLVQRLYWCSVWVGVHGKRLGRRPGQAYGEASGRGRCGGTIPRPTSSADFSPETPKLVHNPYVPYTRRRWGTLSATFGAIWCA
jgi:hypothetical protein